MTANTVIESIGVHLPDKAVSTRDIMRACHHHLLYPLERLTGIRFRRMAGEKEFAIDLARGAMSVCFDKSRFRPEDIDLLICCNISRYDGPNFHFSFEPSTSMRLKKHFDMDRTFAFDISNACAGMFTGVYIANAFIKSGMIHRAMVVSGEYITHLTQTAQKEIEENEDNRVACLTLGDSGAAMILERAPSNDVGFHDIEMFTLGRYSDLCIARPTFAPHGGAIMFTESMKLHAVAIKQSVQHVVHMLGRTIWPKKALDYLIMHQTARTAISQTAKLINKLSRCELLNRDNMINNLAERGNTSSTTHFVAVWDNIFNDRLSSFDNVLFAIQASGITLGTAPYTFDDLPERMRQLETGGKVPEKADTGRERRGIRSPRVAGRVRVESVGVLPLRHEFERDSVKMAAAAGEACLNASGFERQDVGLLVHAGVHRNDFICEPALAALIAGELKLNDDIDAPSPRMTFAYDVINGAIGLLNACFNASALLALGKQQAALVVASEIENNADGPDQALGVQETGSAMMLTLSDDPDGEGFGASHFQYFPEYMEAFDSYIGQDRGRSYLSFIRDPKLNAYFLECIPKAVDVLLAREGLTMEDIAVVLPPQISDAFVDRLAEALSAPPARCVKVAKRANDFYTSSLPYCFDHLRRHELARPGDIGLIIAVGTGIQVGCALYHF